MLSTHLLFGIAGGYFIGWEFLLGSILPDISLCVNEIKLQIKRKKFDPEKVSKIEFILYQLTHSLFFAFIFLKFPPLALGVFFHQVLDWSSHNGKFEIKIFYPFSRRVIMKINLFCRFGHWLPLITRCPMRSLWFDFGYIYITLDQVEDSPMIEIFKLRRIIYSFTWKKKFIEVVLSELYKKIEEEFNITEFVIHYRQIFSKVVITVGGKND